MLEAQHEVLAREYASRTTNAVDTFKYAINGVPVHRNLFAFCEALRSKFRHIKFAATNNERTSIWNGDLVRGEMWAYFPDDEYAPVRVGYDDYAVKDVEWRYSVYARTIRNEKYAPQRDQYYMALAQSMDKAVNNFKKHLRPYTVADVAAMSLNTFSGLLSNVVGAASEKYINAKNKVKQHDSFINELRLLMENSHEFSDATFGAAIREMFTLREVWNAERNRTYHGYYVKLREYLGEQVFDVIPVLDIKKARIGSSASSRPTVHTTYTLDELMALDADLPPKLSTLSMLDNYAFVEGLGQKVSPTSYWVLK